MPNTKTIVLDEFQALEFKMYLQHVYDQEENIIMSVENVLEQL